jgi:uncharacterized protein (TIGR02284 family)
MEREKTIGVLNSLVEINNDRIEGYETASKETDEQDLKILFGRFAQTSHKCNRELGNEIRELGGKPTEGTTVSGKFFRAWMDVKAALTGKDRKAILNSCEYGEDVAVDTYHKVLKDDTEHLSPHLQTLVTAQHSTIRTDHDTVKSMRDALEAVA